MLFVQLDINCLDPGSPHLIVITKLAINLTISSSPPPSQAAGVPTVPGSKGLVKDDADAFAIVKEIGLPVMIKATAGAHDLMHPLWALPTKHADILACEILTCLTTQKFGTTALLADVLPALTNAQQT